MKAIKEWFWWLGVQLHGPIPTKSGMVAKNDCGEVYLGPEVLCDKRL